MKHTTLRQFLAALAVAATALPAVAQQTERPPRPEFLSAMGLLETDRTEIRDAVSDLDVDQPFALEVPRAEGVVVQDDPGPARLFAVNFLTEDGVFIESLSITGAEIEAEDEDGRQFALANLLVLRSFPALRDVFPDAEILAFGPAEFEGFDAVQMVGRFTEPQAGEILFRHVGLMKPDGTDALVAISNIRPAMMPVANDEQFADTYSGWTLGTLEFLAPGPDEETDDAPEDGTDTD
ncbi:hypothetical protein RM543_01940 [Roseicyclus sp. F158]|uniref:Uncharacterized protein n=1 Tax=Tropicimonas omnivorans TaxID=3075590 RepID=A0ABU3DCI1_9RHOB|nr:hypothetical protein [Roseicyclus sp. F158]MDT0681430.1 hypothetical protein [Roseicyclus sp. F158]